MNQALIKHFNLSESDLTQIQNSLQPHQTVLEVLFEKNLIESAAYLAWAKEYYSLPVLKIEFLEKNNNVEALLERYKNVFPRHVVPFHEMEGVLYVMCLEPTPFDAPQTVQYVLAPYTVVSKYAVKNETKDVPQEEIQMPTEKELTNPIFKDLDGANQSATLDNFSFDNLAIGDSKSEVPYDESHGSEGLLKSEAEPVAAETSDAEKLDVKLEDKQEIPAGLNFPPSPDGKESHVSDQPVTTVDLQSFKFDNLMPTDADKKSPTPKPASAIPETPPVSTASPTVQSMAETLEFSSVIASMSPTQTAPAAPATPVPPTPVAQTTSAPSTGAFNNILILMKRYFDQSMVLMFKNNVLEPVAWDSTWNKLPTARTTIDVTTPNIFRIVNESQNPYHGHIVPNQINEMFFTTWNKGQYPQHVTIYPIVQNKKVLGMILGTTTSTGAKKYQLHHVEEIANEALALIHTAKAA